MLNKFILLVTLLSYSFVVSQPFMYMLSLKFTQMNMSADGYIETRQLIDIAMRDSFKYVLYISVFASMVLLIINIKNPGAPTFIAAAIAMIALVVEILLTVKGSLPINDIINTWTPESYPKNWVEYRDRWFRVFEYRQWVSLTGFVSLLIGAVFGK